MTSVSFVICAYNEEKFIGACIDSIQKSMRFYHNEYEIIVVDNASTDATWLKACRDGVRIVFEPIKGISAARLRGAQEAKYDLCAMLDADAHLPPTWLSTALYAFDEDPNIVAVSGPLRFYDTGNFINVASKCFHVLARFFHRFYPSLQGGNYIAKRTALLDSKAYDQTLDFWGEDTYTATRLATVGKIRLTPNLIMDTSGRRLNQDGVVKTTFLYIVTYFALNIFHHPLNKKFKSFR